MKLSVCIPTFNRARFIGEAIQSVIDQAVAARVTEDVEIVISDNASTDDTPEVVATFQRQLARIRYARNAENLGYERNMVKAIELAAGEYCWLLGSDDAIAPGGVATVLESLNTYPNLGGLTGRNVDFSLDMAQQLSDGSPLLYRLRQTTLFENAEKCWTEMGPYFSLFSGQILNRRVVMEVIQEGEWERFCGQLNLQFYLAGCTLKKLPRWLFIYPVCVHRRTGNLTIREDEPAPVPESVVGDLESATAYGEKVARALFGTESPAYHSSLRTSAAYAFAPTVAAAKLAGRLQAASTVSLLGLGLRYYARYPIFWTKAVPILLAPGSVVRPLRAAYRAILRLRYGR
jgi:abequosyltransferase